MADSLIDAINAMKRKMDAANANPPPDISNLVSRDELDDLLAYSRKVVYETLRQQPGRGGTPVSMPITGVRRS